MGVLLKIIHFPVTYGYGDMDFLKLHIWGEIVISAPRYVGCPPKYVISKNPDLHNRMSPVNDTFPPKLPQVMVMVCTVCGWSLVDIRVFYRGAMYLDMLVDI